MKKIYILASAMLMGGVAFGQRSGSNLPLFDFSAQPGAQENISVKTPEQGVNKSSAIWAEDFANGMNSTNGMWTQSGPDQIWKHSFFNSSGEWSAGTGQFMSTSNANGFMLFDADSSNFPISPNYVDRAGDLISPSIDLSGYPAVALQFEQNFRHCCAAITMTASVSTDGGSTWTDFPVDGGVATNAASDNPDLVNVNITSVAGDSSNVQLKFSFSGVSHYFWAIDDICLVTPPDNDLTLLSTSYSQGMQYGQMPLNHVQAMTFDGDVTNQGAATQTNVVMGVDVAGASTYTGTSNAITLTSGATDSLVAGPWTPSAIGTHTIGYSITADSTDVDPSDNTLTQEFEVTDTIYNHGPAVGAGNLWNGDDGNGTTTGYEMGPLYQMQNNDFISSITIEVGPNTDAGVLIYGVVYLADASGFIYENQTNDYEVQAGDIGGQVTLALSQPIAVAAGTEYVVACGHYGGPDAMYVGSGGTSGPQQNFILSGDDNTWYYMTSIPMVKANMVPNVGIDANDEVAGITLGQNYPNPTAGNTTISYELANAGNVTFEIVDITGQKVFELNEGSRAAGLHNIVLDTEEFAAGMYHYTLIVDGHRVTKSMMLTK